MTVRYLRMDIKIPNFSEIRAVALERKIGPSAFANTGKVAAKGGVQVSESLLEAQFLILKSFENDVSKVQMQPVTLYWPNNSGGEHKYTPDALVEYHSGRDNPSARKAELIEIKPLEVYKKNQQDLEEKFAVARLWAKHKGLMFLMATEEDIPPVPAWNVQFLMRYSNDKVMLSAPDAKNRQLALMDLLTSFGETSPSELLAHASKSTVEQAHLLPLLWNLVFKKAVNVNIKVPLNMSSRIWSAEFNGRNEHLS